jgi:hypothetical protein
MLAARGRDRCAATGADGVTAPAIGVALPGSNTMAAAIATAVTAAIAHSVPAGSCPTTASSAAATSSTAAPALS